MYDLHTHSTASDGAYPPRDLVARAYEAGVRTLALTDHDTTNGLDEAAAAASDLGLVLIPAVEISTTWRGQSIHVVGLGVDPGNASLRRGLEQLQAQRRSRAIEMGTRLARAGFPDALETAQGLAGDGMITRTHFARSLLMAGRAKSLKAVFQHYLKPGKPGYVPTEWAGLADAVDWIVQGGGTAVLAHPQRYKLSSQARLALIGEFKEAGGAALEVIAGSNHPPDIAANADLARRFGLAASVGSDFHGPSLSWLKLGTMAPLPAGLTPVWERWT
jgi:3',5'-nucleoside bisphosphate phosphatase